MRNNEVALADKKGIQSVEKAFDVIDAFVQMGRPLKLTEIVSYTGLRSNLVHSYLVSLQKVGVVAQDQETQRYDLSFRAINIGLSAFSRMNFLAIAKDEMQTLAEEVGESIGIAVLGDHGPVVISKIEGAHPGPYELRIGSSLGLTVTASGMVYLAYKPKVVWAPMVDEEIARLGLKRLDQEKLERKLASIRSKGIATHKDVPIAGRQNMAPVFSVLTAPVFSHDNELKAILSITCHKKIDVSVNGYYANKIKQTAENISAKIGFQKDRLSTPEHSSV